VFQEWNSFIIRILRELLLILGVAYLPAEELVDLVENRTGISSKGMPFAT
jgi:hypothetical protein